MRRHGSPLVLAGVIILSLRCWDSSTGWLWNREFQIGGACLQVIARSCSAVPVGRLSTCYGRGRRHLRSSDVYTSVVPRTQSKTSDRSFSVAGPRLWNNLPTLWPMTSRDPISRTVEVIKFKVKVWILDIAPLTREDSWTAALHNLGSDSWLA